MAQKWTAVYRYRWTPIMTFTRRRLQLLDWYEQHVEPVAFVENPEQIGIAMLSPLLRVRVDRNSMIVSTAEPDLPIDALARAIDGVFEVMEPNGAVIDLVNSVWTSALQGQSYNEARARFGARLAAAGATPAGLRPTDASALMDFQSLDWKGQVEWGVVSARELADRIAEPDRGRIRGEAGIDRRPSAQQPREGLPDVSLLVDVRMTRQLGGAVANSAEVLSAIEQADEQAGALVDALRPTFDEGGQSEFAEAQ
ncbi:hypothetical protein [Kribbella sp. HUAS MG21]|uniref:Uncharacterized protein n=1 Tax=Kribbella sp. HUAS MG21 TaxID=3160966 RepID=A0AAU7TJS8_9ACTN